MRTFIIAIFLFFLASCGGPKEKVNTVAPATLPAGFFTEVSGKAVTVSEAKTLMAGKEVIVKGKIMGSLHPFVDNRAAFMIGDPEHLISCEVMGEEDHCSTPWDTCCEPKDKRKAHTLSVQVTDSDERVLKGRLKGQGKLNELTHVIIKGKVASSSTPDNHFINAESIEVLKTSPEADSHDH